MLITHIISWVGSLVNFCLFIFLAVQVRNYRLKMRKISTRTLSSRAIFCQVQSWHDEDPDNRTVILYLGNKKTDNTGRAVCYMNGKKGDLIRNIGIHMHEDKAIEDLYHDVIRAYDYAKNKCDNEESDEDQD